MGTISRDADADWVQGRHDRRKIDKVKNAILDKLREGHPSFEPIEEDRRFTESFGKNLERIGPQDLIDIALGALIGHVRRAPAGCCGLIEIDSHRTFSEKGLQKFLELSGEDLADH